MHSRVLSSRPESIIPILRWEQWHSAWWKKLLTATQLVNDGSGILAWGQVFIFRCSSCLYWWVLFMPNKALSCIFGTCHRGQVASEGSLDAQLCFVYLAKYHFFSFSMGVWTQGLHLEPLHQPFFVFFFFFWDRVSWTICPGWSLSPE
jgi:hypothetical protein